MKVWSYRWVWMVVVVFSLCVWTGVSPAGGADAKMPIYQVPHLKSRDSVVRLKVGDRAPDFTLPSVSHGTVSLSSFIGKKIVVLSFVPAAFTPVCSSQWPMYNMAESMFKDYHAIVLGIATDNVPSLYAWSKTMGGLWFPVLSDFWPHGRVAAAYGVLRQSSGTAERALFVIDKQGIIRYLDIHDINERPPLDELDRALAEVAGK